MRPHGRAGPKQHGSFPTQVTKDKVQQGDVGLELKAFPPRTAKISSTERMGRQLIPAKVKGSRWCGAGWPERKVSFGWKIGRQQLSCPNVSLRNATNVMQELTQAERQRTELFGAEVAIIMSKRHQPGPEMGRGRRDGSQRGVEKQEGNCLELAFSYYYLE
ncbi:MAG: hypothetical protein L6R42_000414 [Xanthoria sp. 1 TBL-2021]|nr:MAG: hypothetical protein L6R42_000414 [Xanthoria sp. 1 TBL-2021]